MLKNMNKALLLSGQARFWDKLSLEGYGDVSLFYHSWSYKSPNVFRDTCLTNDFPNSKAFSNDYSAELIDNLNPEKYRVEHFEQSELPFRRLTEKFILSDGKCRHSVLPMFYSLREAYRLLDSSFDIVVRSRFDITLNESICYDDSHSIKIPDCQHWCGLNDQIAWGPPDLMKKYCHIYDWLLQLYENNECEKTQLNPEVLLKRYLRDNKIPVELVKLDYYIER